MLYNFALGFDWNSTASGTDILLRPRCPLQIAREDVGIQDTYHFKAVVDAVCFDAFNLTRDAELSDYSIVGGSVKFTPSPGTPFNLEEMIISNIGPSGEMLPKTIFGAGPFPGWSVVPLVQFAKGEGRFNFNVELIVEGPGENGARLKKVFGHDPEMIVGGAT